MHHPWILLRGLTREAAHWGSFVEAFEHALPGARVVVQDLPGNGLLHRAVSPATVRGMVDACRAQLAAQGVRPPFRVLAMSLGAMVATEWARVAPEELVGCVLINTSLRPFSPFYQRLRPRNYAALLRLAFGGSPSEQVEQEVLRLTSNRALHRQQVVPDWAEIRRQRPVSVANTLRQLAAAARYRAPKKPPWPTCCCWQAARMGWCMASARKPSPVPGRCPWRSILGPGMICRWTTLAG